MLMRRVFFVLINLFLAAQPAVQTAAYACLCLASLLVQVTLHPFAGGVPFSENLVEKTALSMLLLVCACVRPLLTLVFAAVLHSDGRA